jgi:hypothetical protein
MKAANWEESSGALEAFLNGQSRGYIADLYTVTLADGSVYRWTTFDQDVVVNGVTYLRAGKSNVPLFKRGPIREVAGLEVATLELTLMAGGDADPVAPPPGPSPSGFPYVFPVVLG